VSQAKEQELREALSTVMDPDLGRDIVTLDLVRSIEVRSGVAKVTIELTTPACPHKAEIEHRCRTRIEALGLEPEIEFTARVRPAVMEGKQPLPGVRNLIAFASGKGGVGKSTISLNCALALSQAGAKVGIMDCDIYGPSLPAMLGRFERPTVSPDQKIMPLEAHGLKVVSMGLLTDPTQAVAWRGPMVHKMIQQFLYQVEWGELDYLILDLPPGTGDVQLAVTQNSPLAAAVLITTPQEIALLDARKGFQMFEEVKVKTLGVVENMSYYICPNCEKRHRIFQSGGGHRLAQKLAIPFLGELPLHPGIPSDLGVGKPLMVRSGPADAIEAIRRLAGEIAAQLAILGFRENQGLSFPMEV